MRCCGASIQGSDLILVTVVRDKDGVFAIEPKASRKFTLNDNTDQDSVQAFFAALGGFVRNNNIDQIAIRGRQANGQFAGGSVTFKIEGFLQLFENCTAPILMPPTIAAQVRRHKLTPPSNILKYQADAFLTACSALILAK